MKATFFLLFIFLTSTAKAQNVGIGTSTPSHKLTIVADGIGLSQESSNRATKIGFYTINNRAFLQTHSNHDLNLATNNGPAAVTLQTTTGNLGIGNTNPIAKLDVAGSVRIVDGTQSDGKVLTSDANGRASWKASSYTNTERFSFFASNVNHPVGNKVTYYNLGTSTASIFASEGALQSRITFSKEGLYHLSINVSSQLIQTGFLNVGLRAFPDDVYYVKGYVDMTRPSGSYDKEIDLYIPANTTLHFEAASRTFAGGFPGTIEIRVTGNLIAE